MLDDLTTRFTSRKFLLAVAAFVTAVLSTVGVVEAGTETEFAGFVAAGLYVLVEGVIDIIDK